MANQEKNKFKPQRFNLQETLFSVGTVNDKTFFAASYHLPHEEPEFQRAWVLGEVMIKDFAIQLEPVMLTARQKYNNKSW